MAGSARIRKKPPKSVQSEVLQRENLCLMEAHAALMRDFRSLVIEVSALALCLKERSLVGRRPSFED